MDQLNASEDTEIKSARAWAHTQTHTPVHTSAPARAHTLYTQVCLHTHVHTSALAHAHIPTHIVHLYTHTRERQTDRHTYTNIHSSFWVLDPQKKPAFLLATKLIHLRVIGPALLTKQTT